MQRPTRFPLLAIAHEYRSEPVLGDIVAGYAKDSPFPRQEGAYLHGYAGDWAAHLDSDRYSYGDDWNPSDAPTIALIHGTGLTFQNLGPLIQKPLTGGTYVTNAGERIDVNTVSEAPDYTFFPNTTNYIYLRAATGSGGRGSYAERLVSTSPGPVAGWFGPVHQVATDAVKVTNNFTLANIGFYQRGARNLHVYEDAIAWYLTGSSTFVPNVWMQATGGAAILYLNSTSGQVGLQLSPLGSGTPAISSTQGAAAAFARLALSAADSAGLVCDTFGVTPGNPLVMFPAAVSPAHMALGPWASYLRMYATNVLSGGMLRWRDGSGTEWTPHAAPGGILKQGTIAAGNPVIAAGGATNLHTLNVSGTIKLNHWYLIRVACEANNAAISTFTQAVTITVNGVAVNPYNAYQVIADRDGFQKPWLHAFLFYQHTAADVVNPAIILNITHGAGLGSCQYFSARIAILGSWYF